MKTRLIPLLTLVSALLITAPSALAQASLVVYSNNLANAFQNWSWATVNLANTTPTHSTNRSISVINGGGYQALYLQHPNFNTTPYGSLSFWINGGASGGQTATVHGLLDGSSASSYLIGPFWTNQWQQFNIPLSTLAIANKSNCSGLWIQGNSGSAQPVFYVDDIQLVAAPAPALVQVTVNATNTLQPADARLFGLNTAVWDSILDTVTTSNLLNELDCLTLRFPGGSLSDEYHWATGKSWTNTWTWSTTWGNFMHVATNRGARVFITVNYGSGTSNEAAAWVKNANITNQCDFKYWEIGNECYGTWERDTNVPAHDPWTYAVRSAGYMHLMRQADSSIKIGIVVAPGENTYVNNSNHFARNPRTGTTNYGWTPVLFQTLSNLNVFPDFVVHHVYPQYTPSGGTPPVSDSDPLVLHASVNWAIDAADLRQQLNDYFGSNGTNIEIICTENNSDAGALGRQLTSVVNALYIADSMSQIMKTEFRGYLWWDFRNGRGSDGTFDPTLYGWRTFGDEGITSGTSPYTNYPCFYGFKMMRYLARPGDTVLGATSDYLLLSAYAARKPNGALSLLVINKDPATNFTARINLDNYIPASDALMRYYGILQDEADRTNSVQNHDITVTNYPAAGAVFTNSFPPYSLTTLTFTPIGPELEALWGDLSQFAFQLQGSPTVPYVIETSTDLNSGTWTPVSTNTMAGSTLNVTNSVDGSQRFFRAVWTP